MLTISNTQFKELRGHLAAVEAHCDALKSLLVTIQQQGDISFEEKVANNAREMRKSELAALAGTNPRVFRRWLKPLRSELQAMGISDNTRKLSAEAVAYICKKLNIEL